MANDTSTTTGEEYYSSTARKLTGRRFGRLIVVRREGVTRHRKATWQCECDCGAIVEIETGSLMSGKTRSCGCLRKELAADRAFNPDITDKERELAANRDLNPNYAIWREAVYKRDGYACQACGDDRGGNLVAHHKDGYHWCVSRRYDVHNGATACKDCHESFHYSYGQRNNTEHQWNEFCEGRLPKERIRIERQEYDLSGARFNSLVVVRRAGVMADNHIAYLCKCDCGNEKVIASNALKAGQKSCGCQKGSLIRKAKFDDLSGKRFGNLLVEGLDPRDKKRNRWICRCKCGNTRIVFRTQLIQGKVKDCESARNDNNCSLREVCYG